MEDLASLVYLNESSVLHTLRQRYGANLLHTYAGPAMLVVNPLSSPAMYSEKVASALLSPRVPGRGEEAGSDAEPSARCHSSPFPLPAWGLEAASVAWGLGLDGFALGSLWRLLGVRWPCGAEVFLLWPLGVRGGV